MTSTLNSLDRMSGFGTLRVQRPKRTPLNPAPEARAKRLANRRAMTYLRKPQAFSPVESRVLSTEALAHHLATRKRDAHALLNRA